MSPKSLSHTVTVKKKHLNLNKITKTQTLNFIPRIKIQMNSNTERHPNNTSLNGKIDESRIIIINRLYILKNGTQFGAFIPAKDFIFSFYFRDKKGLKTRKATFWLKFQVSYFLGGGGEAFYGVVTEKEQNSSQLTVFHCLSSKTVFFLLISNSYLDN